MEYRPYNVDDFISVLETKLVQMQQEHDHVRAQHRQTYLPDYDAYPYRDSSGRPEFRCFSPEEQDNFLRVFWPKIVQSLVPSLWNRPIAISDDMKAIRRSNFIVTDSSGQERLMRNGLSTMSLIQHLKLTAWNFLHKDNDLYYQAVTDRHNAFMAAEKAWFELEYRQPSSPYPPYLIQEVQETIDRLEKFKSDKSAKFTASTIFLSDEEAERLKQSLQEQHCNGLDKALFPLLYPGFHSAYSSLAGKFNSVSGLEERTDTQLVNKIKETLALCPAGKSLLEMAEKAGIRIHLRYRNEGEEGEAAGQICELDIDLVNATEENIADQAVALAHELKHFWQRHMFGDVYEAAYKKENSVDTLVRTLVMEADAYAFQGMCAYVLNRCGVSTSFWSSDHAVSLLAEYEAYVAEQGWNEDDAQKNLASLVFGIFSEPDYLKYYEEKWVSLYQPSAEMIEKLPELIASSLYSQPEFLKKIAIIDGQLYLTDNNIAAVQKYLSSRERSVYGIVAEQNARLLAFAL